MAVKAAVATNTLPTSNGSYVDFTVADFGTVDAAIIIISNANSGANPQDTAAYSVGFWTSAAQCCVSITSQNNLSVSLTGRFASTGDVGLIKQIDAGPTYSALTEISATAVTNGIRLTKDSGASSAARYATVILINGVTNKYVGNVNLGTGTSAVNITDPGFRADLVFLLSNGAANQNDLSEAIFAFGAAHIAASGAVSQGCVFVGSQTAQTDSDAYSMIREDCAVGQFHDNSLTWRAGVSANANGFALTPNASAGSDLAYYLALELPDPEDAYVDIVDSKTSTGTQAYTGTGFTPQALIITQTVCTALDTATSDGFLGIGAGGPATTEQCLDFTDEDAQASSDTESEADTSNILHIKFGSAGDDAIAALDSFDADGWTLNYSDGSASARKMLAIAIGASTGVTTTINGAAATIAFAGVAGTVSQAAPVTITGTAADIAFAGVSGTVALGAGMEVSGLAAEIRFTGVSGSITHAAPVTIAGTAAEIAFAGVSGSVALASPTTVTGTAATIALVGGTASVLNPILIAGTAAEIAFAGVKGALAHAAVVTGSSGEWSFVGVAGAVALGSQIGGSLIRRRRTRTPYWDEDAELAKLAWALGISPPERDARSLRSAVKTGLTDLLVSGEPLTIDHAPDGALLLELVGQQIKLQGALKRHVETLMDDEDVLDILNLIA